MAASGTCSGWLVLWFCLVLWVLLLAYNHMERLLNFSTVRTENSEQIWNRKRMALDMYEYSLGAALAEQFPVPFGAAE